MFVLSRIEDQVRILPRDFHLPRPEALSNQINAKYANRIVHGVGLVIRVFDIIKVSESHVHACQDGAYQCLVSSRVWIFSKMKGHVSSGCVQAFPWGGIDRPCSFKFTRWHQR